MLNFLFGAVAGAVIQLLFSILFEDPARNIWRKISRGFKWVISRFKSSTEGNSYDIFQIGRFSTPCVVLEGYVKEKKYYETHTINCTLSKEILTLPPDLEANRKKVESFQKRSKSESGLPQFHNGPMVALESYKVSRTGIYEDPCLVLNFIPTDYYTFLATSLKINDLLFSTDDALNTIRNIYISNRSLDNPCKYVATSFGVNLCVVTSDEYTILGKRSNFVSHYRGVFQVGVCESVNPDRDRGADPQQIDLYKTAIRGAEEELGIVVDEKDVRFFSLCVDVDYYLYGLTGYINTNMTLNQILSRRSVGGAKDKIESSSVLTPRFRPKEMVDSILKNGGTQSWHPASFVAVVQSLVHLYGIKMVEKAFK